MLRGWEATLGMHTVEISLDPENQIWELDETNSTFSFQFEVRLICFGNSHAAPSWNTRWKS